MSEAYIARQPIFDGRMQIYGYEILYRDGSGKGPGPMVDGDQATSSVLMDMFTYHDLDRLLGPARAFINLTPTFLYDPSILPLSRDRLVLEVLEDIAVDQRMLRAVKRLSDAGFTVALDDFLLNDQTRPLIPLADLIKMDIQQLSREELHRYVEELGPQPPTLLAEKVETHEEMSLCQDLGFDYFQGFFLSRPSTLRTRKLPADRLRILQLLERIQDPEATLESLAELVSGDVFLSYRLLRLINSAYFPVRRRMDSIRQAVAYLGLQGVRTWATWIALSGIEDKPSELKTMALTRARMCALMAEERGAEGPDRYFTVGLFSAMDALLDTPLEQALEPLPLAADTQEALLRHRGPMGEVLDAALGYERGDWERADRGGLPGDRLKEVYLDALAWAREMDGALAGEA